MFVFCVVLVGIVSVAHSQTPLDDYIAAPDPYYSWKSTNIHVAGHNSGGKYDAYLINMTSQMWLNSTFVDKPIWWHYLWIIAPNPSTEIVHKNYATIIMGVYKCGQPNYPNETDNFFLMGSFIATNTKTVVGVVYNVPNQPLLFYNDPQHIERDESDIMAWSEYEYGQFYNENSSYRYNWIVEFAMVKSVVKAMDTLNAAIYQNNNAFNITVFGISGGSKRGLATWLTAAADDRVKLFIPMIMDMPNEHKSQHHQFMSYNGWTFAFSNYYVLNITRYIDSEWMYSFLNATDPIMFFDRYTNKTKMIIDGINDEYFMCDDSYYWYDQLLTDSNKYYQMIPNTDHSGTTRYNLTAPTLATFIQIHLSQIKLPELTWNIDNITGSGNITVYYKGDTSMIIDSEIWSGRSCANKRRDFRLYNLDKPCDCGVVANGKCKNTQSVFTNTTLKPLNMTKNEAMWIVSSPNGIPKDHWIGFELAVTIKFFDNHDNIVDDVYNHSGFRTKWGQLILTTQTSIVPQIFPFKDCAGTQCYGVLV